MNKSKITKYVLTAVILVLGKAALIGMHLKRVAVPLKLENKKIGEANVIAASHRPKFVGGERAKYE